jgi:hypothetical protein
MCPKSNTSFRETIRGNVVLEHRPHFGKIVADAREVRLGERDLDGQIALSGADVRETAVVRPWKFPRDGEVRPAADTGHGTKKLLEPRRIRIERGEGILAALRLVLWQSGAERGGQRAPETIEAVVAHLKDAADVGWLGFVEKQFGFRSVLIDSILALEKPHGDQGIEEIRGAPWMKSEPALQRGKVRGMPGQIGENFHFHGAQQGFRSPECHAGLKDAVGGKVHPQRMPEVALHCKNLMYRAEFSDSARSNAKAW